MSETIIPLVDLRSASAHPALKKALGKVVDSARFVLGPEVATFERAFATFCRVHHAVGVGSGTGALHLALRALGIGRGDTVITVAHTFHATAEAIDHAGARVTLIDVEDSTGGMSPRALQSAGDAAAIVPVHLYGQAVDIAAVQDIAAQRGVPVVEDAAQAHGATVLFAGSSEPRPVGSLATLAAFSFYPGKNLGAFGDGGAITTDDSALDERLRRLRDHGRISKYTYSEVGFCDRLDTLQAAVLQVKLQRLNRANEARRLVAARYLAELSGVGDLRLPAVLADRPSVYHLFVVRTAHRNALLDHLHASGIEAGIHYPVPVHLQPAWQHLGYRRGDFPVTEAWARECLSLPIYPELTEPQLLRVVGAVKSFFYNAAGYSGA